MLAGDFDAAALPGVLERAFGAWEPRAIPASRPTPPFPALPRLVLVDRPGAPQSIIRVVGPGEVRTSPERPALGALNAILGGSFTSRLNFNLREQKGYTYGAGSSFGFYRRAGSFTARAAVFTEVTAPAVAEFLREIAAIREAPVTPTELTKARATLLGRVAEGLSTSGGIAAQYAELRLYGLPLDEPSRFVAAIERAERRRAAAAGAAPPRSRRHGDRGGRRSRGDREAAARPRPAGAADLRHRRRRPFDLPLPVSRERVGRGQTLRARRASPSQRCTTRSWPCEIVPPG